MYIKITSILLAVAAGVGLPGCGKSANARSAVDAIEKCDSLPSDVKLLVRAVADNDSSTFAKLVSYPLQRPYPLHDIMDAKEMTAYYSQLVDDSLRNIITRSTPDNWSEYGWRGWSLDDGRYIWLDEGVYDVQYISQKEQKMIDSLTREEIRNIPPQIREGWKPILCLKNTADGSVYRVDVRTKDNPETGRHYRMAIYGPKANLHNLPTSLVEGVMEAEGSVGDLVYRFPTGDGKEYVLQPDATDSANPLLILPNDSTIELSKAYWHELVK